ncbi:MAG: ImmA/IrrE family metallo-endopeptidase [Chloroflexi bacterium]|nr:ImmA/IrrE family metallo-endopeptidase [Chloroflexota bacterium]
MALTQAQLGLRIARAREWANLSPAQLARELGLSEREVQRMEEGQRPVFSFEAATIARLTQRPANWFLSLEQSAAEVELRARAEQIPEWRSEIEWFADFVRDDRLLRDLLPDPRAPTREDPLPPARRLPDDPVLAARALAERDRARAGLPSEAPLDVFAYVEGRNASLVFRSLGTEGPQGFFGRDRQRAVLLVNANLPPRDQRYVAAHLFAHAVVHRGGDTAIESDALVAAGPGEDAANAYAGGLLIPLAGLEAFLLERPDRVPPDAPMRPSDVRFLASRYRLSVQAVLWHLISLGIVRSASLARLPTAERREWLAEPGPDDVARGPAHG